MNRQSLLICLSGLLLALAFGCVATLALREYDRITDQIVPLDGGQRVSFPRAGFSLAVPEGTEVIRNDAADNALCAATLVMADGFMRFAAYENETGERIDELDAQQLVIQYTQAGAEDVRLRTVGSRLFLEYTVTLQGPDASRCLIYETWDERVQLIFETELAPCDVLPILATLAK